MAQSNPYPLRIDKILMEKLKLISKNNGRSVNKEIEILVKNAVILYEKEYGSIQVPNPSEEE